jgi:hypothetical protein
VTPRPAPRSLAPKPAPAKVAKAKPAISNRINVSVGEDGVKNLIPRSASRAAATESEGEDSQKAIDDVTRLIREKLKTLRTI